MRTIIRHDTSNSKYENNINKINDINLAQFIVSIKFCI